MTATALTINKDTPRVWVGCLRAYNAGTLHGEWVDCIDADELCAAIKHVLKTSPEHEDDYPCEEHFFADHENLPTIGEYSSVEEVIAIAELVEEHTCEVIEAAAGLLGGTPTAETIDQQLESYHGPWDSAEAFIEEWHDDCGDLVSVPDFLRYHINWEGVWRDSDFIEVRIGHVSHIFETC